MCRGRGPGIAGRIANRDEQVDYAWSHRQGSAHARRDAELTAKILEIDREHEGRYGIDRIHAALAKAGHATSQRRVRRLARAAGLRCVHPAAKRTTTTTQDPANSRGLVDLVERDFFPDAPNEIWYGDVTYIWTMTGWCYLATVIDGFSRQVIGWAVADHMREQLVLDALRMAIARRRPHRGQTVMHTDSEYVEYRMFPGLLTRTRIDRSVRRFQDVWCRDALAVS